MFADTLTFLHALYDGVPEGYLTLTVIHPDRNHPTPSHHVPLHDDQALIDALEHLLTANARGWGAYFGVAPRRANLGRWHRGGKDVLVSLPALFADIDTDLDTALDNLHGFVPSPSFIAASGHGAHSFWILHQPTTEFAQAERILRGLTRHLGADRTNLTQSLRLPGSVNTKVARNGALCRLIELHPERRYTLADFAAYALDAPACTRDTRCAHHAMPPHTSDLNPRLLEAVTDCLMVDYQGYVKSNGYIAALCPCGHAQDSPGRHFNFDASRGLGRCFGRHDRLWLKDLCSLLRLDPALYGGFFQ